MKNTGHLSEYSLQKRAALAVDQALEGTSNRIQFNGTPYDEQDAIVRKLFIEMLNDDLPGGSRASYNPILFPAIMGGYAVAPATNYQILPNGVPVPPPPLPVIIPIR